MTLSHKRNWIYPTAVETHIRAAGKEARLVLAAVSSEDKL